MAYQVLWGLGILGGLFTFLVCALMIVNNLRLKATDPIHTPALQRLMIELKASPQNEVLKAQIREMDYLARRAFFTSQRFNQTAIWLLSGGLLVTVVAFKTLSACHNKLPYPDGSDRKDDLVANALWARRSVVGVGLILVGLSLSLALPWESGLNDLRGGKGEGLGSTEEEAGLRDPRDGIASERVTDRTERLRNWPSFRGAGSGHWAAANLPSRWDGELGEGILWKTEVPLPGFSSPIIWADRVFVTGANSERCAVYAFDAVGGKLVWERDVPSGLASVSERPEVNAETGYAAPTMATDGVRVFAIFATGDLVAFDWEGRLVWSRHLGVPDNPYGHGSSLEIFDGNVIVQFDHRKTGFVAAMDCRTGETRWSTPRNFGASWASPAVIEVEERTELILAAEAYVVSYDPRTGGELWRVKCFDRAEVVPTPVYADGTLYVAADHSKLAAINVKERTIAWENTSEIPGIGTLVVSGGFLFGGKGDGGICCWDARTGKEQWLEETDDGFYASPILCNGRVFLMERTGRMFIFEASGEHFKLIAQPMLGEEAVTTPAPYGGSLIYRGVKHLFRMGS